MKNVLVANKDRMTVMMEADMLTFGRSGLDGTLAAPRPRPPGRRSVCKRHLDGPPLAPERLSLHARATPGGGSWGITGPRTEWRIEMRRLLLVARFSGRLRVHAASSWSWPRSFSTFSSRPGVGVVIRATLSPRPEIVCATVSARIGACRVHVQGGPGAGGGGTFVHTFPVRIVGFCGGGGVFELAFANSDLHGRGRPLFGNVQLKVNNLFKAGFGSRIRGRTYVRPSPESGERGPD
ncbi:hypothetical protein GEV33_006489 [Tenebrio molitor]|uniref:Uncharacterized protein n=1 Tax=Tenebrio molitor TaxID=7067 RepID=A0A8J6HL14_TENMO|nr:hypothetical protein GEV33_006489 [Tenebrio molitor]